MNTTTTNVSALDQRLEAALSAVDHDDKAYIIGYLVGLAEGYTRANGREAGNEHLS